MSETPSLQLNRLLRGISTYHVETVRPAWRALLQEPDSAIPLVREKLRSDGWRDRPIGPGASYLGVLLALLHELDRDIFQTEIERLRAENLHALHQQTVSLMADRYGDHIFGRINDQVPVYIAREVGQPELVLSYLQKWSQTRDLALSDVTRVDVIASRPEMDYLGKYNLLYDGIVLTWPNAAPHALARWWRRINTELTFYHEVGHHFFQHSEGGQVLEQEQQADAYQRQMFRNAHPVLVRIGKVVLGPAIWIAKRLVFGANRAGHSDRTGD